MMCPSVSKVLQGSPQAFVFLSDKPVSLPMKIRNRTINLLLAIVASLVLRLLFLTVRVDHRRVLEEASPYVRPQGLRRYAFCMWHDGIAVAVFSLKTWNLSGLISQHRDGGYLADAARLAGIQPVRGSQSRGGAEAVAQLLALPHLHLAMTPDGPRGPRRTMKEGIIYISSRSGRPIVPTAITGNRCWSLRGDWTDLLIPQPFSRVFLIAGRPVEVPPDLPREQFAEYARLLQAEMDRLDGIAALIAAGDDSVADQIGRRIEFPHERVIQTGPTCSVWKQQDRAA